MNDGDVMGSSEADVRGEGEVQAEKVFRQALLFREAVTEDHENDLTSMSVNFLAGNAGCAVGDWLYARGCVQKRESQ